MIQDLQATVDVVLLTLREGQLCVALVRRDNPSEPFHGQSALPGGFVHVDVDQDTEDTAMRVVLQKVGIQNLYLEQLQTFSGRSRDPRRWSLSVVYLGLVPEHQIPSLERVSWFEVDRLKSLPFDHLQIVHKAVERVRSKTSYSSLPMSLLPETFTLGELQQVYEVLMQGVLDKRGFRRRIEDLDVIEPIKGKFKTSGARPAQVYRAKHSGSGLRIAGSNIEVRS